LSIKSNPILHTNIYITCVDTAVFVLDKLADCGYNINVASEQFHVSIGDTAGFSLPRVRPYLGRKFFLEEADGVRINYLYRDGPPPCGW
jgi:hypothetical protein